MHKKACFLCAQWPVPRGTQTPQCSVCVCVCACKVAIVIGQPKAAYMDAFPRTCFTANTRAHQFSNANALWPWAGKCSLLRKYLPGAVLPQKKRQAYAGTPQAYAGTPQGYAGTPQAYAGTPQAYAGTPQAYAAYAGTPGIRGYTRDA